MFTKRVTGLNRLKHLNNNFNNFILNICDFNNFILLINID